MAQIRLSDVENGFPSVEAFAHKHIGVLGKTQPRQAFSQVAHVEGCRQMMSEWCRGSGGAGVTGSRGIDKGPTLANRDDGMGLECALRY